MKYSVRWSRKKKKNKLFFVCVTAQKIHKVLKRIIELKIDSKFECMVPNKYWREYTVAFKTKWIADEIVNVLCCLKNKKKCIDFVNVGSINWGYFSVCACIWFYGIFSIVSTNMEVKNRRRQESPFKCLKPLIRIWGIATAVGE